MDIIVTTPKSEIANAAQEAADCIANGGGYYFRRFPSMYRPNVKACDRVFYVEDGYIRGSAIVHHVEDIGRMKCDTTGREWPSGFYVFMSASSWKWITPIPMRGFQGWRRFAQEFETIGGWREPKPEVGR